ncbi:MAG: glycosyltransferase [Bacteroidetes bacterium]|nr:glycosyltransferase [Bacteroidota bacterium]
MKIAYLSTFYPFRGGIAQYNADLYREFEKQHEIKAFTFTRQYPQFLFPGETQYVTKEDKTEPIDSLAILDSINPLSYFTAAQKINQYGPDLWIAKYWLPFFGPSLGTVARRLNTAKKIAILDNAIPHEKRPGDRMFTKYFLNAVDGFICMSQQVQNDLHTLKPAAQSVYQPHPLYDHFPPPMPKEQAREQLGIGKDRKVLLFFGYIRAYKGLDLLIEALTHLPEEYLLLIAGEPYEGYAKYQALIASLGVQEKVMEAVRYITDPEVPLFYSAADVSMLTYKSATQSGVVNISYHYNLPVIVTDVGGLRENVATHQTGIVVDRPEVLPIVQGITEFFKHPPLDFAHNIGAIKEKSSWKSLATTILQLYETL